MPGAKLFFPTQRRLCADTMNMQALSERTYLPVRLKLMTVGVAILIAVVPAALFLLHEVQHLQESSWQYSQVLEERLQQAVAENQLLWKYSVPKFVEVDRHRQWYPNIVNVAVFDNDGRLIHAEESRKNRATIVLPHRRHLFCQGELCGMIQVESQVDRALLWAVQLFLLGCCVGGSLGYGVYACSRRLLQQADESKRAFLRNMETHDATTGVYSIVYISQALHQLIAKPANVTAVLMIDIDFFRYYNDLHGHEQGNRVLVAITKLVQQQLRQHDIAGRFGGEEFIVVLPDTSLQQALQRADQIRASVEAFDFPGAELQPKGRLTVSIGVSSSESAATCQELFQQLDNAIYKAKSAGRNHVCAFSAAGFAPQSINLPMQLPEMKAEVTRKFIGRYFHCAEETEPQLHEPTIRAFLKALEIWDPGTVQHSFRVNRIAMEIANAMELPRTDKLILNLGTLLHDIGKLTIGDTVLAKPGPLTEEEYALMKNHPQVGFDLIKDDPGLRKAADIIIMHHERFDGTGYPLQLAGKQIPLLARICAVADAMDAMMTDRPYSKGKSLAAVRDELHRNRGGQFDPEIVDVVLSVDWRFFQLPSVSGWSGAVAESGQV